jgi:predicted metal-binding membrane protein
VPEANSPGCRGAFLGVSAVLFAASTAATIAWCRAMSDMGEVAMPGGWALSMAWMPMCGQTWADAAASFVGMWAVMMVAMMLPSLVPLLWRLWLALDARGEARLGTLTPLAGAGYFFVWTLLGAIVFAAGAAVAEAVMQVPAMARAVPMALAMVVLLAGAFQFTAWKARHLASCRSAPVVDATIAGRDITLPANFATAWRYGVWLGLQCSRACAGLTAILLVIGVMDLRAMAVVTAAITAERLAPAGERVAWAIGAVSLVAGVYLMGRAAWLP